ncbi:hypothetical protein DYST_04654 [Dyella terrae]|nr:hypothetical protein DYST_04654 [Dyella terrae]
MTGFCPKFPCSPGDLFHFSGLILTGGQLDLLFRRLPRGILSYQSSTSAFRQLATEQAVALNRSASGELSTISEAQSNETFSALSAAYQQSCAMSCNWRPTNHDSCRAVVAAFFSQCVSARVCTSSETSHRSTGSLFMTADPDATRSRLMERRPVGTYRDTSSRNDEATLSRAAASSVSHKSARTLIASAHSPGCRGLPATIPKGPSVSVSTR